MIVGIGNCHIKHDTLPQLHQILFRLRPTGFYNACNIQITDPIYHRSSISFPQQCHSGSKMYPPVTVTVKPLSSPSKCLDASSNVRSVAQGGAAVSWSSERN